MPWRLRSAAGWVAQHSYAEQFRDSISAPPSAQFWLGTDELGRDRFARLLYGTRVSLLLAPAAALLSTLLAALIGGAAGYLGGRWERLVTAGVDLFLSLPWLFLLLAVRALAAAEYVARDIGDDHLSAARLSGLGRARRASSAPARGRW